MWNENPVLIPKPQNWEGKAHFLSHPPEHPPIMDQVNAKQWASDFTGVTAAPEQGCCKPDNAFVPTGERGSSSGGSGTAPGCQLPQVDSVSFRLLTSLCVLHNLYNTLEQSCPEAFFPIVRYIEKHDSHQHPRIWQ